MTFDRGRAAQSIQALRHLRGPLILVLVTIVLVSSMVLFTIRFHSVEAGRVGITVNKLNGEVEVLNPGTYILNFTKDFYTLDRLEQQLVMAAPVGSGGSGGQELNVKTVDGSNVSLDLTVQFQLDASQAETVIKTSGIGDAFKSKWVRDYARSICRTTFGELTTEEFYDANKRGEMALKAKDELNELLNPHGLIVTSVNPQQFHFDPKYEQKISEKKLADQTVEEEVSKARAAQQMMSRRRVEATKAKEVEIQTFDGEMRQLVVAAEAQAQKTRDNADAYAITTQIGADAQFYRMSKDAEATLATRQAEAEGVRKMAEALTGEGGLNIVKLEYVKKLADMTITGQPFTIQSMTERFSHVEEGPARVSTSGERGAAGTNPPPPPPDQPEGEGV